jgi:hypothetical protein
MPRIDELLAHPPTAPLVHVDHGHRKPTPKVASVGMNGASRTSTPYLSGRFTPKFEYFASFVGTDGQTYSTMPESIEDYVDPKSYGYLAICLYVVNKKGVTVRMRDAVLVFRMPGDQIGFQLAHNYDDEQVAYDKNMLMSTVYNPSWMKQMQESIVRMQKMAGGWPGDFVTALATGTAVVAQNNRL